MIKRIEVSPQKNLIKRYTSLQRSLSSQVITEDHLSEVRYVAGVDVAYEKDGDRVVAAVTILDATNLELVETSTVCERESFPYIPSLFSFRELPPVVSAFRQLRQKPDLVVCDGHGYAHPRRFGLACHLGVELDIPSIGCAKKRLTGTYRMPDNEKGSTTDLTLGKEVIGRVLRTRTGVKPVFVSIGHRVSLDTAIRWVQKLCPRYRLPETTRTADHAVNKALRDLTT